MRLSSNPPSKARGSPAYFDAICCRDAVLSGRTSGSPRLSPTAGRSARICSLSQSESRKEILTLSPSKEILAKLWPGIWRRPQSREGLRPCLARQRFRYFGRGTVQALGNAIAKDTITCWSDFRKQFTLGRRAFRISKQAVQRLSFHCGFYGIGDINSDILFPHEQQEKGHFSDETPFGCVAGERLSHI
jgi:hypothetical protein